MSAEICKDVSKLNPVVRKKVEEFLSECTSKGYKVKITETFRTKERQDSLYAKGRTDKSSSIVTNVKYPDSHHCWGIAFDICRNDGTGAYNDTDGWFAKVAKIGKAKGFEWGGDWTSPVDKPHFQYNGFGSLSTLKKTYSTPDKFIKTWEEEEVEIVSRNFKVTDKSSNEKPVALGVIIHENSTYVPIRDIAKLLGLEISFDQNTKLTELKTIPDTGTVLVDGKEVSVKLKSLNSGGTNLVEIRPVIENIKAGNPKISYDSAKKQIVVDTL